MALTVVTISTGLSVLAKAVKTFRRWDKISELGETLS